MAENRELALVLKLVSDQFSSELKKTGGQVGEFQKVISYWKVQLIGAGAALFALAKSTANYGDELVKASQRMGTTVEDTARLQHAARLSDTDLQGLAKSVGILSKNMYEASAGNTEAQRTFDRLGLTTTTANGQLKGTTQILLELNDKFRIMPEGPEKTALALLTLGKSGKEVLPLLNSNMREAFAEADKLGLVMSEKDARAAEHFNDELTKLQGAIRGVTTDVGTALIPKFDALAHAMTTVITDAHAVAKALGTIPEQPQVQIIQPADGGRKLRVLPPPPGIEKAAVPPFFQTEAQATEQERIGKRLTDTFIGQFKVGQALGKEQEQLGKALLEMFLEQNRAIDIQNKLNAEGSNEYFLAFDRKEQFRKEDEAEQERLGKMIVDQTKLEVQIRDEALAKERDGLIANREAWVAYDEQIGASTEQRYTHQLDLLRATLAKQTDLTTGETGRLLIAWQIHDEQLAQQILDRTTLTAQHKETIELQSLTKVSQANEAASNDIFAGWSRGMERYIQDTKSGFGLGADLARRTAQVMEQGFRTFFFDLFDGKINTFKDAMRGLLDFVKQIAAQIAAQLAVSFALKSLMGLFPNPIGGLLGAKGDVGGFELRHSGGMIFPQGFDIGGTVLGTGNRDTVRALLTPGEGVLSRRGMATLDRLNQGQMPIGNTNVTVNITGVSDDQSAIVNQRRAADGIVLDVILRNRRDLRPLFGGA